MTFGSLFAGIGGIDLAFERAGMECRWQVEIDDYATRVLEKHWPDVRRWRDVRTFPPEPVDEWRVDLIAGGFPCQDISFAGKGAGLAGKRSGLFYEAVRVVRVLRPRYVLLENVAALLVRGLDQVLGTLASLGYDAEWHCIPAAAVGAPHIRDRVFILAYHRHANGYDEHPVGPWNKQDAESGRVGDGRDKGIPAAMANPMGQRCGQGRSWRVAAHGEVGDGEGADSDADGQRRDDKWQGHPALAITRCGSSGRKDSGPGWWSTLARFCRMAYGVSEVSHGDKP